MLDHQLSACTEPILSKSGQRFYHLYYRRARLVGSDVSPLPEAAFWAKYVDLFDRSVPGRNIIPGWGSYNLLLMTSQAEADKRYWTAFERYLVALRRFIFTRGGERHRYFADFASGRKITPKADTSKLKRALSEVFFLRMFVDFRAIETKILRVRSFALRGINHKHPLPPDAGPSLLCKLRETYLD